MKNILSILFTLFISTACFTLDSQAQVGRVPVDPDTKLITFKEVVTQPGTKEELFNRAIAWINKEYKNPADVTKVRNPESGLIDILHRIEISSTDQAGNKKSAGFVDYSLRIEMKEGRYRYSITDFTHKVQSRFPVENWLNKKDPSYTPQCEQYLKQIDDFVQTLIVSLKQGMLPPIKPKKDDW